MKEIIAVPSDWVVSKTIKQKLRKTPQDLWLSKDTLNITFEQRESKKYVGRLLITVTLFSEGKVEIKSELSNKTAQ